MQSKGVIASRTLLQSSDMEGARQARGYCPSTFYFAYSYNTPCKYSDILAEYGDNPMLTHECVLSVISQMSKKNAKHPYCAHAHAPSCVASGLMISLVEFYQPKADKVVQMEQAEDFPTINDKFARSTRSCPLRQTLQKFLRPTSQVHSSNTRLARGYRTRSVLRLTQKNLSMLQTRPRAS